MIKKHTEIEVPKGNPFEYDQLKRKSSIVKLAEVIRAGSDPIVMSVEAPWGWGKTTFIKMLQAYLESNSEEDKGNFCINFNAWETDYSVDPLIPLVAEIDDLIVKLER